MRYCPKCDALVDEDATFCPSCDSTINLRSTRTQIRGDVPPEYGEPPFQFKVPGIGRWIIIPITLVGVLAAILLGNWWLTVKILTSMYSIKTGIDWWIITFLDNYYFYFCIGIGLIIALSDPRIAIEKNAQGKRRFYLHSKFWAAIHALVGYTTEYEGSARTEIDDKISLKRGIFWKLAEFLVGALVVGPPVASNMALVYLMISKWIAIQNITWINFIQTSFSILYTRLFTPEALTGIALGNLLIANSPSLEFLNWLKTPILIFAEVWSARLIISAILEIRANRIIKVFRDIVGIGFLVMIPYILGIPTLAFDVTTPFYVRTALIGMAILTVLLVFLSLSSGWVQLSVSRIFRTRVILFSIVIIVLASLLYGPVVVAVQYTPAMGGNYVNWVWNPLYLPNVVYTQWATGVGSITATNINAAINTTSAVTNLDILSRIRTFDDTAAKLRLTPSIGVNWMDFPVNPDSTSVDIISANGTEYWLAPLTIVMPPGGTAEDQWRDERLFITHSEKILTINAANGQIVPVQSVFNLPSNGSYSMYYGEGGLFASSQAYVDISNFQETHLTGYVGPAAYTGAPDYVLSGLDRLWFFSGITGQEQLRTDFATGAYGDVKMLYTRDIYQRLSNILLKGLSVDSDPYIVSDGSNIYYALYIYINRPMPTQYLDYPRLLNQADFMRLFSVVLVNTYDGSIKGYLLGNTDNNYISDFYQSMYPQWNQTIPTWLQSQLRYPEDLLKAQINAYDTYHVSDPNTWQKGTDFLGVTTNAAGNTIEDVRYINFYLNGTTYWAGVRLVQYASAPGVNLAGMYVVLNGQNIGSISLLRTGSVAVIGPLTALEDVANNPTTGYILTTHTAWTSGNELLYDINGRLYYFIPYYSGLTTTLTPTMMAVVDGTSQKVGYYAISQTQDPTVVGSASEMAYLNLNITSSIALQNTTVVQTATARAQKAINYFEGQGYTVQNITQPNPQAQVQGASVSYLNDAEWTTTNSTISSFITTWAAPNNVQINHTILMWQTVVSNINCLNFGVFVNQGGTGVLHYITIAYG